MRRATLSIAIVLTLFAQPRMVAHHSFAAEFDVNKRLELKGTVIRMEWVNPHSWLYIDVKSGDRPGEWAIEFGAPNSLFRKGWRKDMLPVGDMVTVVAYAAKNGSRRANAQDVTLPDGKKLFAGSSGPGAPPESPR
jgi:hypothetical protein